MADELEDENSLAHYGVKGMRWGHRKDPETGTLMKTSREARKDAEEFARAKMFYGDGAGTRRKLIKATVDSKAAKDGDYKRAFDHHMEKQDMGVHASKARGERRRKDVTASTAKTARGVKNILTGSIAPVTLTAIVVAGAGKTFVDNGGMTRLMNTIGNTNLGSLRNNRANMRAAEDLLRRMGMM